MKRLRFALEAAAFRALLVAARGLPRRGLLALGSAAGTLGYALDARHRRIALENLRRAFGDEMPPKRARSVARACWRHFGRIMFDTLAFPRLGPGSVGRLVRYEGLDHLREAGDLFEPGGSCCFEMEAAVEFSNGFAYDRIQGKFITARMNARL